MTAARQLEELGSLRKDRRLRKPVDQLAIRLRIIAIYESQRCEYPRIVEVKS